MSQSRSLLKELTIPLTEARSAKQCIVERATPEDLILTDMQSLRIAAPLFGERIDLEWIPGVRDVAVVGAGDRTYLVVWRWRLMESAPGGMAMDILALLEGLRAQPDERWKLSGRRVWLLQGGWGDSLLRRLTETLEGGRRLRGPIHGGENLGVCRFYPDTYRTIRERKTE